MKQFIFFISLMVMLGAGSVVAAESPVGKWNTVDEKYGKVTSQVEIYEQSGKLFGKIVALTEPNDKQGKPKVCIACTGADKNKPIVGLVILRDLSRAVIVTRVARSWTPRTARFTRRKSGLKMANSWFAVTLDFSTRRGLGSRVLETD